LRKIGEILGRYIFAGTVTMMTLVPEIPGALDAISPAGLGDGQYRFATFDVRVSEGRALRSDGALAGGIGTLKNSFDRLRTLGVPFESALASMTFRPAALIGRPELGTLTLGGRTTVV